MNFEPAPLEPAAAAPSARRELEVLEHTVESLSDQTRAINSAHATRMRTIEQGRRQMEAIQAKSLEELRRTGGVKFESNELARRSYRLEVGVALGIHEYTAGALISCAEQLVNRYPLTLETLAKGAITERHAQVLTETGFGLPDEHRIEYERLAVNKAQQETPARFKTSARKIRARLHPEELEEQHKRAFENRRIFLEPAADGMARFTIENSAVKIYALDDRLTRAAKFLTDIPGEDRTLDQLRTDMAVRLLLDGDVYTDTTVDTSTPEAGEAFTPPKPRRRGQFASIQPSVHITVPVLSLLGKSDEPATLDGYGPIPLSQAAELAAGAPSFTRILTHPETGAVLSVGRESYRVPKDLARWVQTRDGTCRQYSCGRPARRSDIDHTIPWTPASWRPGGGQTSDDNLACLCPAHHTLKHARLINGWGLPVGEAWGMVHEEDEDGHTTGTIIWTTPSGQSYATEPDVIMQAWRDDTPATAVA